MAASPASLALICVGGGSGQRFGGNKLAQQLGRWTVFETALQALSTAFPSTALVAVCPAADLERWRAQLEPSFARLQLVAGGTRRQGSVRRGVEAAVADGAEVVAVHDAARPLVDPADVRRAVAALGESDGVLLCARVADTVKQVSSSGRICATLPRDELRLAQTPQVLRVAALQQAWQELDWQQTWTDEAAMLEATGRQVLAVEAQQPNPKITNRQDLELVRALLAQRDRRQHE